MYGHNIIYDDARHHDYNNYKIFLKIVIRRENLDKEHL